MRYTIPIGTTVDVRRAGDVKFRAHTTRRILRFDQPKSVAYGGRVLYFEFEEWLISVRSERVIDQGRRN